MDQEEFDRIEAKLTGKAEEMAKEADDLFEEGKLQEALWKYHSARDIFSFIDAFASAAQCAQNIGLLGIAIRQWDLSVQWFVRASEGYEKAGVAYVEERADSELYAASSFRTLGRDDSAEEHYACARRLYLQLGMYGKAGSCELSRAQCLARLGDWEGSASGLQDAQAMFVKDGDGEMVAESEFLLARLELDRHDVEAARIRFRSARDVFLDRAILSGAAKCERELGYADALIGGWENSREKLLKAAELFTEAGDEKSSLECGIEADFLALERMVEGKGRVSVGEASSSVDLVFRILKLIELCDKEFDHYGSAYWRLVAGETLRMVNQFDKAERLLVEAKRKAESIKSGELVRRCERNRALVRFGLGDLRGALELFLKVRDLEKVFGNRQSLLIAEASILNIHFIRAMGKEDRPRVAELSALLGDVIRVFMLKDAFRFKLRSSSDRLAWGESNRKVLEALFAASSEVGDETLMADLVEVAVNYGVFGVKGADTVAPSESLKSSILIGQEAGVIPLARMNGIGEEVGSGQDSAFRLGGGSHLIAGAALPLLPPPGVRMPDGHLTLTPWLDLGVVVRDDPLFERQEIRLN